MHYGETNERNAYYNVKRWSQRTMINLRSLAQANSSYSRKIQETDKTSVICPILLNEFNILTGLKKR